MKWFCEIVQDADGKYYANMTDENGLVSGLPEYVDYLTLKKGIREKTGRTILNQKDLKFTKIGRKRHAYINACFPCKEGACVAFLTENLDKMRAALTEVKV